MNKYYLILTNDCFNHRKVIRTRWYHKWFGLPRSLLDVVYAHSAMEAGFMFAQRHGAVIHIDASEMRGEQ